METVDLELRAEVEAFYAEYAAAIDQRRPDDWVARFADDGTYSVTSHDNHVGQGLRWFTDVGRVKLTERAAVTHGYLWVPWRKTLHMITNVRAWAVDGGEVRAEAYVAVFLTNRAGESVLQVCGEYHDRLVRTAGGLRYREHLVVVDAVTLPANLGILL